MSVQHHESWIQRMVRWVCGQPPAPTPPPLTEEVGPAERAWLAEHERSAAQARPAEHHQSNVQSQAAEHERAAGVAIVPAMVERPEAGPRITEGWRELLEPGRRVVVSWSTGGPLGVVTAPGEVRLIFEETVWVWLDEEMAKDGLPLAGQAVQVLTPRNDAMRLIPGRLVEESLGLSLQIAVSGRVSRVQRRSDVRARVNLPPVSAVRLNCDGRPVGLLGLRALDLSAGGIRVNSEAPLQGGDRLRLSLRLDDRDPLTVSMEVLTGGVSAQGRFGPMPDRDRQRIVQYVYQQQLAQRRQERKAAQSAD